MLNKFFLNNLLLFSLIIILFIFLLYSYFFASVIRTVEEDELIKKGFDPVSYVENIWDSKIRTGCKEERAEEIRDREKANFCEWFLPQAAVPIINEKAIKEKEAWSQLQNLFGANNEEAPLSSELEKPAQKLDDLFS